MITNMDYSNQLLDSNALTEPRTDTKMAVLRSVSYRTTVDDRPYFRLVFMDANGFSVVGRMFSINDYEKTGKIMNRYMGHVCIIEFDVEFPFGEASLNIRKISAVKPETEGELTKLFRNSPLDLDDLCSKYSQLMSSIRDVVPQAIKEHMDGSSPEITFRAYSQDNIGKGATGAILDVIVKILQNDIDPLAAFAFVNTLECYCRAPQQSDALTSLMIHNFITIASLEAAKLCTLSDELNNKDYKILVSDFIGLLTGTSTSVCPNTQFIFDLYTTYCRSSDMKARTRDLPMQGFIQYGKITLRK